MADAALLGGLFVLFAGDVFLHAPVDGSLKKVGLAASLAAPLVGAMEAFVAVELLWVVLLVYSQAKRGERAQKLKAEAAAAAASAKGGGGPPELSKQAQDKADEALRLFIANLDSTENCDKKPWKLEKSQDGIEVFYSDFPGQSIKRWKAVCTIKGKSLDAIVDELFNFDKRVGANGWDTAIKEGKVVASYNPSCYSLARMVTNAAGGGTISSREFFDLRVKHKGGENPAAPEGGIVVASVGLDPNKDKWVPNIPKPNKSLVTGQSFPGGGCRITPVAGKPDTFKYEMCTNMNLNGWIPVSAINSATSSALLESHQAMCKHLSKCYA